MLALALERSERIDRADSAAMEAMGWMGRSAVAEGDNTGEDEAGGSTSIGAAPVEERFIRW